MIKHSFWMAVCLGIILPWILFATKENTTNLPNPTTVETTLLPNDYNTQMISVGLDDGSCIDLELERYILGVIIGEMPESFDQEALKAQAVVARTYAVKSMMHGYKHADFDVCISSSCCQSYYDPVAFEEGGGSMYKFLEAVEQTKGQVLLYENNLIEATYFSCSGGRTEDARAVWGTDVPYLRSQSSPGEQNANHYTDTVYFSSEEFQRLMEQEYSGMPGEWIGNVTYTNGGGVESIQIGGITYTGTQVRQKLSLYSTAFVINAVGDRITITTKGFGHRVGMSQYGADAMAVQGCTYQQILEYYYPGTTLESVENV